eukprot:COSAG02_NODE_3703_length_6360_cov_13.412714_5_plen_78_part_00
MSYDVRLVRDRAVAASDSTILLWLLTGELLYALMVQRHGKEHITMSPSAFSFAASLWLQSGDTNHDGTLDVDEFVKL